MAVQLNPQTTSLTFGPLVRSLKMEEQLHHPCSTGVGQQGAAEPLMFLLHWFRHWLYWEGQEVAPPRPCGDLGWDVQMWRKQLELTGMKGWLI